MKALQLIRFLSVFGAHDSIVGDAVMLSGGKSLRFEYSSIEELLAKVKGHKFNQFELTCRSKMFFVGKCLIKSITGVFTPSASSTFWFSSKDWPTSSDRLIRSRKMNAKAKEISLRTYNVAKPNLFELVFECIDMASRDEVLGDISNQIVARAPDGFVAVHPFGCCDVGGNDYFVEMEAGVTMTEGIRIMAVVSPSLFSRLGSVFDKLHPLLFGNAMLCSTIAAALGRQAVIVHDPKHEAWAAVHIKSECDLIEAAKLIPDCLLLN